MFRKLLLIAILNVFAMALQAQQVVYSEYDRNDLRQTNFEILGKVDGNLLIYKSLRDKHYMSVYDMDMKQLDKVKLEIIPDRVINVDFLTYPDFAYLFYQFQKKNVVYCMGAKFNGNGKLMEEPVTLDTTVIGYWASNKIYSVINSEDKNVINVVKINTKNDDNHIITTVAFNRNLEQQERQVINIKMPDRHDYLTEFQVDNNGNMVFARAVQDGQNNNVNRVYFFHKQKGTAALTEKEVNLQNMYLDDLRIKPDNTTNRYIITSFYSKNRNGNIEGLLMAIWDNNQMSMTASRLLTFNEELRSEAKGESSVKTAFNDYYIKNIIPKKDGGFILAAEAFYTTGRGGFNRFNYMYGSPFLRPSDYYLFNPYSYGFGYPWWRYNGFSSQMNRYHAENIIVLSFDSQGKTEWSNVLVKNQWDDETDALIGYQMVNTGDQLHFLFNMQEKRTQLLTDQSIKPDGQLVRNPTLKNLDQNYDFMPRFGKQVGLRQIIVPCMYRNYLCFARVEL